MPLTLGVEEELHLVDAATGRLVAGAGALLARSAAPARGRVVGELTLTQVEAVTDVCSDLDELDRDVRALRAAVAAAARAAGLRALACGTPPLGGEEAQELADDARYRPLLDRVGALADEQLIAGAHVHVGVQDGEEPLDPPALDGRRVAVVDGLRPWLPVLLAMGAASPRWQDRDTGFASWRQVHWHRWPVTGPPPPARSPEAWWAACERLVSAGVVDDASFCYWDARLSTRYPTVEVRVLDAVADVEDLVVLAGLCRGVAAAALAGRIPAVADASAEEMRGRSWRAARHGLSDRLTDPVTGRLEVAAAVVRRLLEVAAAGAPDDERRLHDGVDRLLAAGDGATRQRAALQLGRGALLDLLDVGVGEVPPPGADASAAGREG